MPLLNKLGLLEVTQARSQAKISTVNLFNQFGKSLSIQLSWMRADFPYALAISREILDTLLLRHAQALGASVLEKSVVEEFFYREVSQAFELSVKTSDVYIQNNAQVSANILVDAAGRNSHLYRQGLKDTDALKANKLPPIIEPYVGVQCHIKLDCDLPELNMYWFKGGYGGIQALDSNSANLCLWVKPELAKNNHLNFPVFIESSIGQNIAAQKILRVVQPISPIKTVGGIHSLHRRRASSQSVISVGDALLAVEPFSGFGMSHALSTGILAAEVIDEGMQRGWTYDQILEKYLSDYQTQFDAHLFCLQWIRPIINQPLFQKISWPFLPPFLPLLARLYR